MPRIGVLAYGSLMDDPGDELLRVEVERRSGIRTPFRVEFARASSGRGGAPTLVPVSRGGAHVESTVIVLDNQTTLERARDMVYRREIDKVGREKLRYQPDPSNANQVYVELLPQFAGLDWVLYTRISQNITEPNGENLAQRAIQSARGAAGDRNRDGISYLKAAISNGVRTPLTDRYLAAILEETGEPDLDHALAKIRSEAANRTGHS